MTATQNEENSSPSPPCRIVVHAGEPFQDETHTPDDPLPVLGEKDHGSQERVAAANESNLFYHESCAAGGRTTVSNTCSRAGKPAHQLSKKGTDTMTDPTVPQGYLKYWALRVGQEAADIPESEEFETAYAMKAQSLFPFRSTTTEWTVNTAGGFLVLLMPWGPVMMLFGLCLGGLLGFGFAMANDMCRLRKKTSAATQQKKKIDHLMRWAGYHFASSNAQLQLIFKVIMEYEVLARLGDISKTARAQLRLLYSFLSRDDVGHCLWLYLDYFEAHYEHMTRSEIFMCAMVCYVCTQCAGTLRKRNLHPVVTRMIRMMHDAEIQKIFQKSKTPNPKQAKLDEQTERCLFYADNSQGVQTFVMKGGDLLQSLHNECTAGRNAESSEGSSFTDAFSGSNFESEVSNEVNEKADILQETLAGELRPVENFNVALTYGVSLERALGCTLEGTSSPATASLSKQLPLPLPSANAVKTHRRKTSSVISNTRSTSRASRQPTPTHMQSQTQTQTEETKAEDKTKGEDSQAVAVAKPEARLFKSYEDLINFDITLKHQTPIAPYEFQFLEEKEPHDPSDPSWERTVDQELIQVYKFISPDSPVVVVKAYAQFDGIPLHVLSRHIKDIKCRLEWDTTFADYRVIEDDVDGCEMIYCLMKAPFPVSNRDFLQWRRTIDNPEEGIVKMMLRSADHPSVPEKSGCVRAETLMSGYLMRRCPNNPNSSTLFIVAQTDVKGLIPKWLVNSAAAKAPVGWVDSLRRACSHYMKEQQRSS